MGRYTRITCFYCVKSEVCSVCIDDASRLAPTELLPDEKKDSAVAFLNRALGWFKRRGVMVERILTDNGSADRATPPTAASKRSAFAMSAPGPTRRAATARPSAFIQTPLRE